MYRIEDDLGFVAHPRTASRSTRDLLVDVYGATKHEGHHQIAESDAREILQKGGVMACTVRNMFDVLVSWYYNAHYNAKGEPLRRNRDGSIVEPPTFDYYVREELIRNPRHRWFMTPMYFYGLPWCKVRLRYEHLEEDTAALIKMIGRSPTPISKRREDQQQDNNFQHIGKSIGRNPDYRVYYDRSLRKAVEDRWGTDLHLTNYEF